MNVCYEILAYKHLTLYVQKVES